MHTNQWGNYHQVFKFPHLLAHDAPLASVIFVTIVLQYNFELYRYRLVCQVSFYFLYLIIFNQCLFGVLALQKQGGEIHRTTLC